MSYIKTTQLDGDVSVGRNVAIGGKANIAGNVSIGHNLKVKGWLDAPNIKDVNKGIFPTVLALREAYPNPHDGWFAGVGDSTPFTAYRGEGGEWVATGGTINVNVDMTQFTEDLEQLQEDMEEGLGQLDEQKPDVIDLADFDTTQPLPLGCSYCYDGLPVHSAFGESEDGATNVLYLAFCIGHENNTGFEPQNHTVMLFTKVSGNYMYSETFNTEEASSSVEIDVARALAAREATTSYAGLMSADDKGMFDDMVTEVFPLTVAVASSNAGTYEVGDAQHSVTPQIVLSITRKGADVSSSANTTSSEGEVQSDHKTITGSALTSGTTTFQISVSQGGQTRSVPNQVFDFMNYMYYGEVSTKPASATAVATLCQNGTLGKQLSRATTKASTNLAANKYYVFAVKGSVNLVCRHAGTDAVVTGCTTGTVTIQRVNNSGSDSYSYIIVEKSASAWSFKITNS